MKSRLLSIAISMATMLVLDAKKITKDFLEGEIADVKYQRLDGTLTHCTITTHDGFTFTGESACIDPAQFDEKIGQQIAYSQAFDKMWMPYSFWLNKTLKHQHQPEKIEPSQTFDENGDIYEFTGEEQFGFDMAETFLEHEECAVRRKSTGLVVTPEDWNAIDWQVVTA